MTLKKIILFIPTLLLVVGCQLDYKPENTMVDETVYKDESTAEAGLLGAYVNLCNFLSGAPDPINGYTANAYVFLFGDLGTDNLKARESYASLFTIESSGYTSNDHEGTLKTVYLNGNKTVDLANNALEGIRTYGSYNPEKMKQHMAEAKFVRAYAHFYLLCLYGDGALLGKDDAPGIVLHLTPFEGYDAKAADVRSSNATVWQQIIKDLEEALPDLPDAVPEVTDRVRANKAVAQALLSRVYLYKGTATNNTEELRKAADYAQKVLSTPGYSLKETSEAYLELFPRNTVDDSGKWSEPTVRSNELLFFERSRLSVDAFPSGIRGYLSKDGFFVPKSMADLYTAGDIRGCAEVEEKDGAGDHLIAIGSSSSFPKDLTSMKYPSNRSSISNNDVPYIRLAEMKLTHAEALTRVNAAVTPEAVAELNTIRKRAYTDPATAPADLKPEDFADSQALLLEILKERRRELAYECHHRFDLMRTNNLIQDETLGKVPSDKWNLPFPEHEVRISSGKIVQNSGYPTK